MASNMFLKLSDVEGEAVHDQHKGEIDVLAWSWGASQTGTMHETRGGGAGKANFQDLSFTKWLDASSPILMKHCTLGTHLPDAVLTLRKASGDSGLVYLTITLKKVMVSSVSLGGSQGEEQLTENVTLNFAEFKVEYQPQDEKGAKGGGTVEFGYEIALQKEM